jgi:shikimate dehydrogenase
MNFLSTLTGCFAQPVSENPTVVMMEAAYRHHGLECRYINMEVSPENLADAVRGAKAQGYVGFNCSLPHKVAVIEHLDELTDSAKRIGAVNCAIKKGDSWIGENTDGKGFLLSLQEVIEPQGKNIVILGAGGAARAIAVELALAGVSKITLANRSAERGEKLVQHLKTVVATPVAFIPWPGEYQIPEDTDVVVNATSMGLFPDVAVRIPVSLQGCKKGLVVADVIPNPPRTRFLQDSESQGFVVLDGLGMLVNQGAANIEYWTGVAPDKSVMRAALEHVFSKK